MTDNANEVVVLWRYDLYPFVIGGVGTIDAVGDARVPSFQMTVRRKSIMAVLPVDKGSATLARLKQLKEQYRAEQDALEKRYMRIAIDELADLKEHPTYLAALKD